MKCRRPCRTSDKRTAVPKWPSLALAALLCVPPAVFVTPPAAAVPMESGAITSAPAPPPSPAVFLFEVNTTGDAARVSGGAVCDTDLSTPGEQCTLRAAIQAANDNAGADDIGFSIPAADPNCDANGRCTIKLAKPLPDLSTDVSINGPGADKLTVRRDAPNDSYTDHLFRVFSVTSTGAVSISGLTITNGFLLGGGFGGGIENSGGGTLTVTACAVVDNLASGGGGINNRTGTTNVVNSLIARNTAPAPTSNCCSNGYGGGISNEFSGTLNVTNSTITGNSAIGAPSYSDPDTNVLVPPGNGYGGGVSNSSGVTNITNCTISGNIASADPSGNAGVGQGFGGGVYNASGTLNLKSTIVANNTATTSGQDIRGQLISQGYNLVEDDSPEKLTNQQGTDLIGFDPKLDQLKSNGGPTETLALLEGSPAIDKGTSAALTGPLSTDQRGAGFQRTADNPSIANAAGGDGTDIGAFEFKPTVQFSSTLYGVTENTASINITVKRTGGTGAAASVRYTTTDGTARAGQDYTAKSGTLQFAAGESSKTFAVPIINDTLDEADETVNLTLGSPSAGLFLGTPSRAVLKIVDNDAPPTLSINNATVTEGDSGYLDATFTVTLSAVSGKTVTVHYATANGTATATADYAAKSGTVSFSPGQTSKPVTVSVRGDLLDEANESFFVNLGSAVNAPIGDGQGLGTITDNDPPPKISINDVSLTELDSGTVNAALTVKLSAASGLTVSVKYQTANGTASSATDYVAKTGTLTFSPGQTSKTVVVAVRGDTAHEANETFFVNLSAATNATIADAQGKVTILNDD